MLWNGYGTLDEQFKPAIANFIQNIGYIAVTDLRIIVYMSSGYVKCDTHLMLGI